MNMRTILGKAVASAVLSAAAVGGIGAVGLVAAGTASARPDVCAHLRDAYESAVYLTVAAHDQGDYKAAASWRADANLYQKRYKSAGCS